MKPQCIPYTSNNVMGIDETLVRASRHFDFTWGDVYWRDDVERWEARHNAEQCVCGRPSEPKWFDNWGAALEFIAVHQGAAALAARR